MDTAVWIKPQGKCGESSHCPEIAFAADGLDMIYLRNSRIPEDFIVMTLEDFRLLRNDPAFDIEVTAP